MIVEFWLMRVVLHRGKWRDAGAIERRAVLANVESETLACLPDGSIAEPVEVYASQLDAEAARERAMRDAGAGADYRVVLNSSLDTGERA